MIRILFAALFLSAVGAAPRGTPDVAPILRRAVVRLETTSQRPDWYSPWKAPSRVRGTGSGFVIRGGRVLTGAHVVSDASMIVIHLDGDSTPHEARVVAIGHDCDLALVEPVQPGVIAGIEPLEFADLPKLGDVLEAVGYPAGGERLSLTRGVVSRIEVQTYVHDGISEHLVIQTDSAINPGNSGGPFLKEGRVVGVAFQAKTKLQNVSYAVPTAVVRHFLADLEDGRHDGFPALGVRLSPLTNPAAQAAAGLRKGVTGARVDAVFPGESAFGVLAEGDVLLRLGDADVDHAGRVLVEGSNFKPAVVIDRYQAGASLPITVLRDRRKVELSVILRPSPEAIRFSHQWDRRPPYYVYGGLVFVPLDVQMLKTFGDEWPKKADRVLMWEALERPLAEPDRYREHRVVLLRRLNHPVNIGVPWYKNVVVEAINQRPIRDLADVIAAIEGNQGPHHVLEFALEGRVGVLDREATNRANPEILKHYGVKEDRRLP